MAFLPELLSSRLGQAVDALTAAIASFPGTSRESGGLKPMQRRVDASLAKRERALAPCTQPLDQRIPVPVALREGRQ